MDFRLVALGANLVFASVIVGVIGWGEGHYGVVGVAASILMVGATALALGVAHKEPSVELVRIYGEVLRSSILKVVEDLGLLPHDTYSVPAEGGRCYIVLTRGEPPKNPAPIVGFNGGQPYVAIEACEPLTLIQSGGSLDSVLHTLIVEKFMAASSIITVSSGGEYVVRVSGVNPQLVDFMKKPLSPITTLVLAASAMVLGKPLKLVREEVRGATLEVAMGVAG